MRTRMCAYFVRVTFTISIALAAVAPSTARATPTRNEAHKAEVCNAGSDGIWHCDTYADQEGAHYQATAAGMPQYLDDSCSPYTTCTMEISPQYYGFTFFDQSFQGSFQANPNTGIITSPPPHTLYNVNFNCWEVTDEEEYKCEAGTGGLWGGWRIRVWY
jgi:hypothetical protein